MRIATELDLRQVRERNTAALNASEMARFSRLIAYGAVRAAKRDRVGRDIDQLWTDAEARITAEVNAVRRQKEAAVQAKVEAKLKARAESRWW
jgi:hypothetical protein